MSIYLYCGAEISKNEMFSLKLDWSFVLLNSSNLLLLNAFDSRALLRQGKNGAQKNLLTFIVPSEADLQWYRFRPYEYSITCSDVTFQYGDLLCQQC